MSAFTVMRNRYAHIITVLGAVSAVVGLLINPAWSGQATNWTIVTCAIACLIGTQLVIVDSPRKNGRIEPVPTATMWLLNLVLLAPMYITISAAILGQLVFSLRRHNTLKESINSLSRTFISITSAGLVVAAGHVWLPHIMNAGFTGGKVAIFCFVSFVYFVVNVMLSIIEVSIRDLQPPLQVLREDIDLRLKIYTVFHVTGPLVALAANLFHPLLIFIGLFSFFNVRYVAELVVSSERRAVYDGLTGIGNRRLYGIQSEHALKVARLSGGQVGLFLLDVDHFKDINDNLGHDAGDVVIKAVAERLAAIDGVEAFRLGGDEYVLLAPNVKSIEQLADIGQQVLDTIRVPVDLSELNKSKQIDTSKSAVSTDQLNKFSAPSHLPITTSVGIALFPDHGSTLEELVKSADTAMYRAKEERNTACLYEPALIDADDKDISLLNDLHEAVANNEIEMYYQPKVDANRQVVGIEALMRWNHKERGFISPEIFVTAAESAGLIVPMTCQAIETSMRDLADLRSQGHDISVSINLSAQLLNNSQMIEWFEKSDCISSDLSKHVIWEITESAVLRDTERADRTITLLRSHGCRLSVDDYGTGFSNLERMAAMKPDELKIDKSFILNLDDPTKKVIVDSTIRLCKNLGVAVVAEGVETEQIDNELHEMNCDIYQGYYYARPMSKQDLNQWLSPSDQEVRSDVLS